MPDDHEKELEGFIAKNFSTVFQVRALVTFSMPDNPRDPYYDLIFD